MRAPFRRPWPRPPASSLERSCLSLIAAISPEARLIPLVSGTSIVFLAFMGGFGSARRRSKHRAGCAPCHLLGRLGYARLTAGVGALFGTATAGA